MTIHPWMIAALFTILGGLWWLVRPRVPSGGTPGRRYTRLMPRSVTIGDVSFTGLGWAVLGAGLLALAAGLYWGNWSADPFLVSIIQSVIGGPPVLAVLAFAVVAFGFVGAHTPAGQGTELAKVARWVYRLAVIYLILMFATNVFEGYGAKDPVKPILESLSDCAHDYDECPGLVPDAEDVRDSLKRLGEGLSGLFNGGESGGREESPPDPVRAQLPRLVVPAGETGQFRIPINGTPRLVRVDSGGVDVTFRGNGLCWEQLIDGYNRKVWAYPPRTTEVTLVVRKSSVRYTGPQLGVTCK